jgi:hypothetical protein
VGVMQMVLSNNKLVMLYGFEENEIEKINEISEKHNLPKNKIIDNRLANMKIESIIKGINLATENAKIVKEKVVLFNNLEDSELESCIKFFKSEITDNIIFAVVTKTSINWTFTELLEHLLEERKFNNKRRR